MVIIAKIISLGVIPKSSSTFFDLERFRVSNAFLKLMNIIVNFYEQEIPYEKNPTGMSYLYQEKKNVTGLRSNLEQILLRVVC